MRIWPIRKIEATKQRKGKQQGIITRYGSAWS